MLRERASGRPHKAIKHRAPQRGQTCRPGRCCSCNLGGASENGVRCRSQQKSPAVPHRTTTRYLALSDTSRKNIRATLGVCTLRPTSGFTSKYMAPKRYMRSLAPGTGSWLPDTAWFRWNRVRASDMICILAESQRGVLGVNSAPMQGTPISAINAPLSSRFDRGHPGAARHRWSGRRVT